MLSIARKKNSAVVLTLVSFTVFFLLLLIVGVIQSIGKRNTAKQTAQMLLNQTENILNKNLFNEQELISSLKEDYIVRAHAASYIIEHNPSLENNVDELRKITTLLGIDEICLFDKYGEIYGGTVPEYVGIDMDSGEQIHYFKPMLFDKTLSLCQDLMPNTAQEKPMMYAAVWKENGNGIVQVGIEPVRLLNELKRNEVQSVLETMPMYDGVNILVAERKSGKVIGTTNYAYSRKSLHALGFKEQQIIGFQNRLQKTKISGRSYYIMFRQTEDYTIGILQSHAYVHKGFLFVMVMCTIYFIVMAMIVLPILLMLDKAEDIAHSDKLTGLLNRRAYEEFVQKNPLVPSDKPFVFAAIDVNGLKKVNDTKGHAAGDELICGASKCLQQCFGQYGNIYRTGGDEFVAVLFVDDVKLNSLLEDFNDLVSKWTGSKVQELSVSIGAVTKNDLYAGSVAEASKLADQKMYKAKEEYYRSKGVDRRGQQDAFRAVCSTYNKILKVNLTEDTYSIITMSDSEKTADKGFSEKLSEWLKNFAQTGQIYEDDVLNYLEETDVEGLRKFFAEGNRYKAVYYRRKSDFGFVRALLEVVPAEKYAPDNQVVFLYVKSLWT